MEEVWWCSLYTYLHTLGSWLGTLNKKKYFMGNIYYKKKV